MTRRTGPGSTVRTGAALLAATLFWGGAAHAQSAGSGPLDFLGNIFNGSSSKGSQAPSVAPAQGTPAASGAPLPWSGEDGASGHPLMTASAIREAAANFDNCVAAMWRGAGRRNTFQA